MPEQIQPRLLKGFRDSLPQQEMERREIIDILEKTFEQFGFVPIDTPVLEYSDVLLGKGGGETDKQVYRFFDHGDRDVAMRFDLTVPFARFMAAHVNELYLPFKRYHTAKVWRGENTQRGRYREFMQCDFDIVGVDAASADLEILLVMKHSMEALGINDFRIHFSHRGVFNTLLEELEISDKSVDILRTVDKLSKLGREKVASMLAESIGAGKAETVLSFTEPRDSLQETLAKMEDVLNTECNAITRLKAIIENLRELGVEDYFFLNPGITRGLDYYTGIVYETFLTTIPEIGSICSGGRYNDLASLYTKEKLPGVGSSIGLDRLMAALQQLKQETKRYSPIQLIILCLDDALMGYYHSLAEQLREAGVNCEVYPEQKKLAKQFSYAEKKQIPYALICGEDERASGTLSWKNLETRESREQLSLRDIIDLVKSSR